MRYTTLDFETEVINQSKELNIMDILNKKVSYTDGAIICLRLNNNTMNEEQLYKLAVKNIYNIKTKFSYKGLRIWFYSFCNDSIMDRFNELKKKYSNLIHDIEVYHNELLEDKFCTALEYYIYCSQIKKAFDNEFGIIDDYNNSLYAVLKTIKDTNYDKNVINSLLQHLKDMLLICGDKYYLTKDLTDKTTLQELYLHIGEETLLDIECININQLFYRDDGYGNSISELDEYTEDISNFKRW